MLSDTTNLGEIFHSSLIKNPHKIALIDGESGVKISFQDLENNIAKIRSILDSMGISKGDRIALFFPNQLEFIYTLFGSMRVGAVPVLINIELPLETCSYIVQDSGASLIISSSKSDTLQKAIHAARSSKISRIIISGEKKDRFPTDSSGLSFHDLTHLMNNTSPKKGSIQVSPTDAAFQPYTSGSTGNPKGVVLTHGGSIWNASTICKFHRLQESDRAIVAAPMYHSNALNGAIQPMLLVGGSTVILRSFDSQKMIKSIDQFKVTYLRGVPAMFKLLVDDVDSLSKHDVSSIEWAVSGSSSLPESLITSFERIFNASMGMAYGLTEGGPIVTLSPRDGVRKIGSSGVPLPGVVTHIINPATNEKLLPGAIGELIISSPGMGTYHNLPDIEKLAFEMIGTSRFLHTGDLAYIDDQGFHYIVGRIDDMMNVGGENVYPAEVESLLSSHPSVKDACVISLPHSIKGEAPVALVIADETTEEEIKQFALKNGPAYAHPRRVLFVSKLPLSGTGKIDRIAAKNMALQHSPDPL